MTDEGAPHPWLPPSFVHPERVRVSPDYHLRPIRRSDVEIDYPAVMRSRERLWSLYGDTAGWPRAEMTQAEDEADLARHAREMTRHESFNYAVLDDAETLLAGCIYLDPPTTPSADAEISWWVIDELVGSPLNHTMRSFVPAWIARDWPFTRPHFDPRSG